MSQAQSKYIQVVIASPLRRHFDYLPKSGKFASEYAVGTRVRISFGRRKLTGLVIGHANNTEVPKGSLKQIEASLDREPLLTETLMTLVQWISDYYHHPYGDTLFNLLPNQLRKGGEQNAYQQRCWKITTHGLGLPETALARAPKQQSLLTHLRVAYQQNPGQIIVEADLINAGHKRPSALQLAKKLLIEESSQAYYPNDCQGILQGLGSDALPTLNSEQGQACESIASRLGQFDTVLLEGITGSGKTEVYLRSIAEALSRGTQVLVLIPEIGLTPQTINRFVCRFTVPIAVFHSGLTDRERLAAWTAAKEGYAKIIIGTRSAVFTPMLNPGLIIIDEEHDGSYKQQDSLRYSARDVSIVRASLEKIPVVLGSATPSLETLFNVQTNKYRHAVLNHRAGGAQPPTIELLDIRNLPLHEGFSDAAIKAIGDALSSGQQAMVFINRRGYAPLLMCHDCGWHAQCHHCDARLTLHNSPRELRCHHCDQRASVPSHCPRCQSNRLLNIGQGTQKSTDTLSALFPQYPVVRIDRDTTQGKKAIGEQIEAINRGEPTILVGTQMLAKGHHFPALHTVVVLDIDQGLFHPDFRGPEKTVQLLTQVAGRAGRSRQIGRVIVQTHMPEHPLMQLWQAQGYQGLIDTLLTERSLRSLPPYSYMAVIRADSKTPSQALSFLAAIEQARLAHSNSGQPNNGQQGHCQIVGPLPAVMEKRAGRHRAQLQLTSTHRRSLHQAIDRIIQFIDGNKLPSGLRWSIDVDPQEVV